jgi:hypothetical protein
MLFIILEWREGETKGEEGRERQGLSGSFFFQLLVALLFLEASRIVISVFLTDNSIMLCNNMS